MISPREKWLDIKENAINRASVMLVLKDHVLVEDMLASTIVNNKVGLLGEPIVCPNVSI